MAGIPEMCPDLYENPRLGLNRTPWGRSGVRAWRAGMRGDELWRLVKEFWQSAPNSRRTDAPGVVAH